jgi:serine/threonine protein kinase
MASRAALGFHPNAAVVLKHSSPYEIISAIGAGGMGEVYRARDTRLERIVALKLLPSEVSSDKQALERFLREARTAICLATPVRRYSDRSADGNGILQYCRPTQRSYYA